MIFFALSNQIPFDDRICHQADMTDLNITLIKSYLKEMHLTEGRNTGFRKILKALERNGSPLPEFITDDEHIFFITRLFIREDFYDENGIENSESGVENAKNGIENSKSGVENVESGIENDTDIKNKINQKASYTCKIIEKYSDGKKKRMVSLITVVLNDCEQTIEQISTNTGIPNRSVSRYMQELQEAGALVRNGSDTRGKWILK